MAWDSSHSPFAINWDSYGSQGLGQESQNYDNHFLKESNQFSFPMDESLQHGHIQGSRCDPITAGLSSHITPYTNHHLFDFQAVDDHLNHHENAMTSAHELPRLSPRVLVPSTDGSSTPQISQTPHPKHGPASDRVKKSKYVIYSNMQIYCLLTFLIMIVSISLPRAPLVCGWMNCKRPRPFTNEGTLIRHIRTQHINPRSVECPKQGCSSLFSRKENMEDHVHRVHKDSF